MATAVRRDVWTLTGEHQTLGSHHAGVCARREDHAVAAAERPDELDVPGGHSRLVFAAARRARSGTSASTRAGTSCRGTACICSTSSGSCARRWRRTATTRRSTGRSRCRYWNYDQPTPRNTLPIPFRPATALPNGLTSNPLNPGPGRRRASIANGAQLSPLVTSQRRRWRDDSFSGPPGAGFGGEVSRADPVQRGVRARWNRRRTT